MCRYCKFFTLFFCVILLIAGGKLYVWGSNAFGQLGTGKSVTQQTHPIICEVCSFTLYRKLKKHLLNAVFGKSH